MFFNIAKATYSLYFCSQYCNQFVKLQKFWYYRTWSPVFRNIPISRCKCFTRGAQMFLQNWSTFLVQPFLQNVVQTTWSVQDPRLNRDRTEISHRLSLDLLEGHIFLPMKDGMFLSIQYCVWSCGIGPSLVGDSNLHLENGPFRK